MLDASFAGSFDKNVPHMAQDNKLWVIDIICQNQPKKVRICTFQVSFYDRSKTFCMIQPTMKFTTGL